MHHRCAMASLTCLLALAAAGCGGSGEGLDASGRPIGEGGGGNGELVPTLASIQQHVFTPMCTTCHAGALAPEGLRLDAANSAQSLVGVPSNQVSSLLRVAPGDPDASYLIRKLQGSGAVLARMPLGGPYLDAATLGVIREWISQGAPQAKGQP